MRRFFGPCGLLLATPFSSFLLSLVLLTNLFSLNFLLHAAALPSSLDATLGLESSLPDAALLEAGNTPRALSFSAAAINFGTQVATNSGVRAMLHQWTHAFNEVLKGPDTTESNLPYYWKVPECVLTVDFASAAEVAVSDSSKIALAYNPNYNAIMLAYVEESAETFQVLKRPTKRIQFLHLPAECMVDENTTYSAFCMKPNGQCLMVRLDINLTRIVKQMMDTLTPIGPKEFILQQMKEGMMYDDAVDILNAPTTIERLLFDSLNCIMHTRVRAASPQHISVFLNSLDHSLRIDAQNGNNSWFRRKVILPLGCGGTEKKDFTAVVYLQPDGYYKVIIQTPVARGTDQKRESETNIEIKTGSDIRPTDQLKVGEHDYRDMYPHANFIPFETMVVGHPY